LLFPKVLLCRPVFLPARFFFIHAGVGEREERSPYIKRPPKVRHRHEGASLFSFLTGHHVVFPAGSSRVAETEGLERGMEWPRVDHHHGPYGSMGWES
jgi:hypothetical protein